MRVAPLHAVIAVAGPEESLDCPHTLSKTPSHTAMHTLRVTVFERAKRFNQDLAAWNVAAVTNMNGGCRSHHFYCVPSRVTQVPKTMPIPQAFMCFNPREWLGVNILKHCIQE